MITLTIDPTHLPTADTLLRLLWSFNLSFGVSALILLAIIYRKSIRLALTKWRARFTAWKAKR